jgi:hypothetical protein
MTEHRSAEQLEAGLAHIQEAPRDGGELRLIVRRPATDQREVLAEAQLDTEKGLLGDNWQAKGSRRTDDGSAHPDMQLNIMNVRATALIAGDEDRWPMAGDQLYIDMDLSEDNLPPGTRLAIGDAVVEVTAEPHLGCQKFKQRFGEAALRFVNSERGKQLHLRGINARVVSAGTIRSSDTVAKVQT